MPSTIDYRALIQDRRAKQTRPTVRHVMCLAPELFSELEDLKDEQRAAANDKTPAATVTDRRMGDAPPPTLPTLIAQTEAKIAAASVVGVFKAPSAERQAELNKAFEDDELDVIEHTIGVILDAFTGFEVNRVPISSEDLGRSDLVDLLPVMSQGELVTLGNRIVEASAGAPDLPLSVRRSLLKRHSAETSKRRSSSGSPASGSTAGNRAPRTTTEPTES